MRILHCPTDVGGHASGLVRAERALGADSTLAVFERSCYGYPVDIDLGLGARGRAGRLAGRARFAARAIREYDVFHFNFGATLLPLRGPIGLDLPLLGALGRRVFATFQGCDARQTGYCGRHFDVSCCGNRRGEGLCAARDDAGKARRVAYLRRHANNVFCVNPDLLHIVRGGEFVPYASCDPQAIEPAASSCGSRVTVVHAPTNRAVKGTEEVLAAAAQLEGRHGLDLLLVEGVAHDEAMARYRQADLAIDQLRVGWYGGFAVEMMAMGKPVIAYIREGDLKFVPPAMAEELPIVRAEPGTLARVLADLLEHRDRWAEIGARSRRFVERWHDPRRIAERLLALYRGERRRFWDGAA